MLKWFFYIKCPKKDGVNVQNTGDLNARHFCSEQLQKREDCFSGLRAGIYPFRNREAYDVFKHIYTTVW